MTERQSLAKRLIDRGFRRLYPSDKLPLQYQRDKGTCQITVQLWEEGGRHRVSSAVDNHHDRVPSYFEGHEEMWAAIAAEEEAARIKLHSQAYKIYRAGLIAAHCKENYDCEDAADIALDELEKDPDRHWLDVAKVVAMRIKQP
jgi:hypothetical protein